MGLVINFLFLFPKDLIKDLFGMFICFGTPLSIIVGLLYLLHVNAKQKAERLKQQRVEMEKASDNYYKSLKDLKLNPTNADLKQLALELGRIYSEMTRQLQGVYGITLFDEIKLMNDINAACAAATATANVLTSETVEDRLAKLVELKEKNLISEQEYEEKRLKILDTI